MFGELSLNILFIASTPRESFKVNNNYINFKTLALNPSLNETRDRTKLPEVQHEGLHVTLFAIF